MTINANDWTGGNPFLGMNNPFLQQNIDNVSQDVVRNYNTAVKPQMESSMVNSGSFGNSGLAQLQQEQQRALQQSLGNVAGSMRMQDYGQQQNMYQWDQGFNRNLFNDANAQNNQNLSAFMGLTGQANQFNQQDIANTTQQYNMPMQYQQAFGNMANAAGGLGGTSTGTQNLQGSPVAGAIGGWGLGQDFSRYFNNSTPPSGTGYGPR